MSTPLAAAIALKKKQLTDNRKNITTVTAVGGYPMSLTAREERDLDAQVEFMIKENQDLINPEYLNWYRKCFRRIGLIRGMEIASQVRHGYEVRNKKALFGHLVKKYYGCLAP